MAYQRYQQSLSQATQGELQIAGLVNQDIQIHDTKLEENIRKWGDLALGMFEGSAVTKGLMGMYGNYKKNLMKKLNNATEGDLKADGVNSDLLTPLKKSIPNIEDLGGQRISTSQARRLAQGESPQDVLQDEATPRAIQMEDFTPADLEDVAPRGFSSLADDPFDMAGLPARGAKMKAEAPEAFEPQFEGPVAPRGFGTKVEEVTPRMRSWDQTLAPRSDPIVSTEGVLEPSVQRAVAERALTPLPTEAEQKVLRRAYKAKYEQGTEPTFKPTRMTQGQDEFERGIKTARSDAYAEDEGLEPIAEAVSKRPALELPDVFGDKPIFTMGQPAEDIIPRGGPIAETEAFQPQGVKMAQAFMKGRAEIARPQPAEITRPQPARPISPSQEIRPATPQPVAEDPPTRIKSAEDQGEPPAEVAPPKLPTEEVGTDLGTDVGSTVGDAVGEATEMGIADSIPVVGQIAALGMGIYDLVEMFKHHPTPKEHFQATGISFDPTGEGAGSGLV